MQQQFHFFNYPGLVVEKKNGFRVVENSQKRLVSGKPGLETLLAGL